MKEKLQTMIDHLLLQVKDKVPVEGDFPVVFEEYEMEHIFIVSAEDAGNLCIRLTFNDGHQSVVNVGEFILLHPHPQYNKYLDPDLFRTFVVDDGNVVWGEDWDLIFPIENLYMGKAA